MCEEVRFYRFCESLGSTNVFIWIWKKICVDQQRYSRMHAYHVHREFHGSTYMSDHQRLCGVHRSCHMDLDKRFSWLLCVIHITNTFTPHGSAKILHTQSHSRMHAYHIHREFHGSTYIDTDHQRLYGSTAVLMDPQRFLGIGKDFQGPETISGNPQIFS